MKKAKKIIAAIALVMSVIMCVGILCGCVEDPKRYTLEQHMERISERVEKRYFKEDTKFTGYKLYPLYNANEELSYFLVEFEPCGFVFVSLNTVSGILRRSMYMCDSKYIQRDWQRYRIINENRNDENWLPKEQDVNTNRVYETDENGKFIEYKRSPYFVASVFTEKMYALDVYLGIVPAVKRNGQFINLVSMKEFEYKGSMQEYKELGNGYIIDNISYLAVDFIADSSEYYLD